MLWQSLTLRALVKFTRLSVLSVSQWGTVNSTGFGSAGIQTQVGKTWEKRRKRLREDLTNLNQFDRFHIKKILRRSTSCALHVAICYPMLPIFRIFLTFWFYILVQWDLVRCSEAKQGMLRQRWAGFGIASAATSPWHGQDSAGNLDEPGVNLGWTWVTSNAKRHRNVHRMFTEWKKTEQQWTAMNSIKIYVKCDLDFTSNWSVE